MAKPTELQILIKTIADQQGIKVTEEGIRQVEQSLISATEAGKPLETSAAAISGKLREVGAATKDIAPATQSVDEMAKAFAAANAKGGEFGETLTKLTNEQLLELEEKLRAEIKAQEDLGKSTDDLRRKLEETYSTRTAELENSLAQVASGSRNAAGGAATLTRQMGSLKTAAAGASQVMNGLSQGSIGGLVLAARGAITTITALAGGAIGTVLIPVLSAAAAGFLYLRNEVQKSEAQLKKWADESDRSSARRNASLEEMKKASDASLKAQLADVEKLSAGYNSLNSAIEKSRQTTDTLNKAETERKIAEIDAREAEALEQAKTPEAQAGVQKKFAADRETVRSQAQDIEIENRQLGAQTDRIAAEDVIKEAQAIIDQARKDAADAARAAAEAKAAVSDFRDQGGNLTKGFGAELLDDARVKAKADAEAKKNFAEVEQQQRAVVESAEARLADAKVTEQLAELAKRKLEAERRSAAAKQRVAEANEREARIAEQVANGVAESVARNREKPNQGGTVVTPEGAFKVDPGVQKTPEQKAGEAAIEKAEAPKPIEVAPAPFRIPEPLPTIVQPPLGSVPPATAPVSVAPTLPAAVPNPFLPLPGLAPAAASGAAPADVQAQNNATLDTVAQKVEALPTIEPLDATALEHAQAAHHQANQSALQATAQKLAQLAAADAARGQQIADLARTIAQIQIAQRNAAEAA